MKPGRRGAAAVVLAVAVTGATAAAPVPGRYDGELCVATGGAVPSCGAADVELQRGGRLNVRVSDIVYRLRLHSSQVDVVLMHGMVQIDGFRSDYEWVGRLLQFVDTERNARYELRVAATGRQPGGSK